MTQVVVIAASRGGLQPLRHIVDGLEAPCNAAIFITCHTGAHPSILPDLLTRPYLPAAFAKGGEIIEAGKVYIAPPDHHLLLKSGIILLDHGSKIHHSRPAADPLFYSAANAFGRLTCGIVLSGGDGDGAEGLRAIKAAGGLAFVQHPEEAASPSMPLAAIEADTPEILFLDQIVERVRLFCNSPGP